MPRCLITTLAILFIACTSINHAQDLPSSPEPEIREPDSLGGEGKPTEEYDLPEHDQLDWSRVRGVNYLPAYAASPYHMWKNYNPDIIRLDLVRAHQIGFNSVRVFLSFLAYESKPSAFIANWQDFMQAAQAEGLTVMPVLFDSWGVDLERDYSVDAQLGAASATTRHETTRTAYDKFRSRPDAYALDVRMYERMMRVIAEVATPDRPVPVSTDPSAAFWGDWAPSPGINRMTGTSLERCDGFVKAVIEPFKTSSFIAAWDIMNEPDSIRVFTRDQSADPVYEFVSAMLRAARAAAPFQPITVGASDAWRGARVFVNKVDVVSLHAIQESGGDLSAALRQAELRNRPAVVTACGALMFPSRDEDISHDSQLREVRDAVSQMRRVDTGFYLWHLIEGKGVTPWCGLLNADGTPKPAAELLKKEFAKPR